MSKSTDKVFDEVDECAREQLEKIKEKYTSHDDLVKSKQFASITKGMVEKIERNTDEKIIRKFKENRERRRKSSIFVTKWGLSTLKLPNWLAISIILLFLYAIYYGAKT